jgi:hypothetical protein
MTATLPALILQPRDREVLSSLGENGLMDTEMLHARHFADVSHRRCRQRLSLYQQHNLTRTTTLKLWTNESSQRAPTVHCLTERGVEVVLSFDSPNGNRPLRVSKGEPQPATIHHRLQIVRTKLILDAACRANGLTTPHWILEQDRDPTASSELPPNQRRLLYHAFHGQPPCTCQPDAACRFPVPRDLANLKAGINDVIGFFEIDRSSEGRKQITNKLPGYARLLTEHTYARYFPKTENAVVRVFWVCRSAERIASLRERFAKEAVAQFFRFTTIGELNLSSALTTPIWQDLTGKRREILRLPTAR